jgi:hypothetical protein
LNPSSRETHLAAPPAISNIWHAEAATLPPLP